MKATNLKALFTVMLLISFSLRAENNSAYIGYKFLHTQLSGACSTGVLQCNDSSFGHSLYMGYELYPWLSLEGALLDLGSFDAKYQYSQTEAQIKGIEATGKLSYGLSNELDLYFRGGFSFNEINKSTIATDGKYNTFNTVASFGLDYSLLENFSFRTEYSFMPSIGNDDTLFANGNQISLGLTYYFNESRSYSNTVNEDVGNEADSHYSFEQKYKGRYVYLAPLNTQKASVYFSTDSIDVLDSSQLDDLLNDTNEYVVRNISVYGYADSVGSGSYNLELSARRAVEVKDYVSSVMPNEKRSENKIIYKGLGEQFPVGDNNTLLGRAKNRRVDVRVRYIDFASLRFKDKDFKEIFINDAEIFDENTDDIRSLNAIHEIVKEIEKFKSDDVLIVYRDAGVISKQLVDKRLEVIAGYLSRHGVSEDSIIRESVK